MSELNKCKYCGRPTGQNCDCVGALRAEIEKYKEKLEEKVCACCPYIKTMEKLEAEKERLKMAMNKLDKIHRTECFMESSASDKCLRIIKQALKDKDAKE
jgi:hypothetical protein